MISKEIEKMSRREDIMKSQISSLSRQRMRSTRIAAAIFLTPVLILMLIYIVYPIIDTFVTSTYRWNGIESAKTFIGVDNWKTLVADKNFWKAFRNNIIIMICSIAVQLPIGLALATFLDVGGKKFNLFKVVWFLPLLMSSVAIGFLFRYALSVNGGIISTISQLFGGQNIDLLGNQSTALYTVIGVICWQFVPFYMVYFMAAFTGISFDIYEASIIDGATRGQYFWRIAFPLMVPTMRSAAILSMVGSLKYFDLIWVMTKGGPGTATELMATYMYKNSFTNFKMGYGSTVAAGMFILITVIALITMKLLNGKKEEV